MRGLLVTETIQIVKVKMVTFEDMSRFVPKRNEVIVAMIGERSSSLQPKRPQVQQPAQRHTMTGTEHQKYLCKVKARSDTAAVTPSLPGTPGVFHMNSPMNNKSGKCPDSGKASRRMRAMSNPYLDRWHHEGI
jgi:hypothetical protein